MAKFALLCLVLLGGIFSTWRGIKFQDAWVRPIKYVRVEGRFQHITKKDIKKVLDQQLINGFYYVDLQQIKHSVETLPWVWKVSVKRAWPDAINIQIFEQQPVARWGKLSLINDKGELFTPEKIKPWVQLPRISGPVDQQKQLLKIMKGLAVSLQDQGMTLKEFYVNKRLAWKVILTNGTVIKLGRKTPLKVMRRFLKTIDLLGKQRVQKIAVVDLRYPNGYAVRWKTGIEAIDWKSVNNRTE